MSSDYQKRLEALYEQASHEKDPEKLKQLISEILAVLEAHQQHPRDRQAESADDKTILQRSVNRGWRSLARRSRPAI